MKIFFTITFIILFTFSTVRLSVNANDNSISNEIDMGSTTPINQIANFYLNGTNPVELGKVNWLRNFDVAVEVLYDPEVTSYAELISKAKVEKVANHVFVKDNKQKEAVEKITAGSSISEKSTFRADDDPKHYLAHTFLKYVPMTQLQSARVNAAIAQGKSPEQLLSPSQLQLLEFIKKHPDLNWRPNAVDSSDYITAWNSSMTIVSNYYK